MLEYTNKKIAVYGGSFNPIHIGHLLTGFDLLEKLNYDLIMYIPANIPSHKTSVDIAGGKERLNMVKMSIKGIKNFVCSDIEIKRGGISYTIDTVDELIKKYNLKNKLGIVFGDDLLDSLGTWKEIERLNDITDLICLKRYKKDEIKTNFNVKCIENRLISVSSSEIRDRIKKNLSVDFILTGNVKRFIFKKKLYRN